MHDGPAKQNMRRLRAMAEAALRAAAAGAGPRVNVPQNAPSCPEMPRESSNLKNEPTARAGVPARPRAGQFVERNIQHDPIKRHEMPHPAPQCPAQPPELRNEPTAGSRSRGLTPRQLTAISALFAGHSFSETARYLQIDRKTLFRWRNSAPFIAEVRRRYAQQMSAPSSSSRAGLRG